MNITVVSADRLTDAQLDHWTRLQLSNSALRSPFLHPCFCLDAAAVWGNVEVAVLSLDGTPAGFFPFQRTARNVGIPVGGLLNDYQSLVAEPDFTWDAVKLIRACRLSGWRFTQLAATQRPFQPYHWRTDDFHSLELANGFEAYCRGRREAGSDFIPKILRKSRNAVRDLGPLRFESRVADPKIYDTLIDWKSRQYRRIRSVNHLTTPGTHKFLTRLLDRGGDDLRGDLSAMYFGEQLVAVHLGLRCRGVLHLWFPTYNEEMAQYSPGLIFFLEQARAAAEQGVVRVDMGRGEEKFKTSLRSCGTPVAQGAVGLGFVSTSVQRAWLHTKHWVQSSAFREPARSLVRQMRGFFHSGRSDNA